MSHGPLARKRIMKIGTGTFGAPRSELSLARSEPEYGERTLVSSPP